jgi:hypothetical protein
VNGCGTIDELLLDIAATFNLHFAVIDALRTEQ